MALSHLFSLFAEKMEYLTQRQALIGQNIANANTPHYKPSDLESFDKVLGQAQMRSTGSSASTGLQMAATQAGHMTGSGGGGGVFKATKVKDTYEVKPSGNAVVLEQQMTNLAETNAQYQMITGLYRKSLALVKAALGKGGN